MIALSLHLLVLLALPPVLLGVITRTKAVFAGRRGPPILQPWYDLLRLLQKDMVISQTTTWVFQLGPLITLASILMAGMLVPLGTSRAPVSFTGWRA